MIMHMYSMLSLLLLLVMYKPTPCSAFFGERTTMDPPQAFTKVNEQNYADITDGKIKGCVMMNRYDEDPNIMVMTCRGADNQRTSKAESGIIFYDVLNTAMPTYITHWESPTTVEGQDSLDGVLVVASFDGKVHVFKDWHDQVMNFRVQPTATIQTSAYSLLHLKLWKDYSTDRVYALISTGFAYSWPSKTCDIFGGEEYYQCGNPSMSRVLKEQGNDVRRGDHGDRGFDGVVIVDVTDPFNPREISSICIKTKCPEGVTIFYDTNGWAYGTVGGVNSEYLTVLDLNAPTRPLVVAEMHKDHLNQMVPLYGIHPQMGPHGQYEPFAMWGFPHGGISIWNFDSASRPHEAAYLDSVECSNSNRAIFWNDRYVLTPLEGFIYGGVCVFDVCAVNKPVFRSWMHFQEFGFDPMARTTYGMNAFGNHAFFAIYKKNVLATYRINIGNIEKHTTRENRHVKTFEKDTVYLDGFNEARCNFREECVHVSHINENPGFHSCGCVFLRDPCFEEGECVEEPNCPALDGQPNGLGPKGVGQCDVTSPYASRLENRNHMICCSEPGAICPESATFGFCFQENSDDIALECVDFDGSLIESGDQIYLASPFHNQYVETFQTEGVRTQGKLTTSARFTIHKFNDGQGCIQDGDSVYFKQGSKYIIADIGSGVVTRTWKSEQAKWTIHRHNNPHGCIVPSDEIYFRNPSHVNYYMSAHPHHAWSSTTTFDVSTDAERNDNYGKFIIHHWSSIDGYIHHKSACINGGNIAYYKNKSLQECKAICDGLEACKAFEFGVDYGRNQYKAGDCNPQDTDEGVSTACGNNNNLDTYVKDASIIPVDGYTQHKSACIGGHNIAYYKNKSLQECKAICDGLEACKAFEYGVDYGRNQYKAGDCNPQDTAEGVSTACGNSNNLDTYVKDASINTDCVPYSEEACAAAAERAGYDLGYTDFSIPAHPMTFPFRMEQGPIKGCWVYNHGAMAGSAFYNPEGTQSEKQEAPHGSSTWFRPIGYDCGRSAPLRQTGESCGSCFCPPTFSAGQCAPGNVCVHPRDGFDDSAGTCMEGVEIIWRLAPLTNDPISCTDVCQNADFDSCTETGFDNGLTRDQMQAAMLENGRNCISFNSDDFSQGPSIRDSQCSLPATTGECGRSVFDVNGLHQRLCPCANDPSSEEVDLGIDVNSYNLVFRQSLPYLFSPGETRLNAEDPTNANFAILDELEQFRAPDGRFYFELRWPGLDDTVFRWSQTSNPVSEKIAGYQPIDTPFTGDRWGGLEPSTNALMDGSVNHGNWWFAIGAYREFQGGIPAYHGRGLSGFITTKLAQVVELYARPSQ